MSKITLKPNIELGVVPTHIKFVGGLVPDENGCNCHGALTDVYFLWRNLPRSKKSPR